MNHLKSIRLSKGISIYHLATLAKSSPATISAIERYDFQPTEPTKSKLAQALGVEVNEIWSDNAVPENPVFIPQDA